MPLKSSDYFYVPDELKDDLSKFVKAYHKRFMLLLSSQQGLSAKERRRYYRYRIAQLALEEGVINYSYTLDALDFETEAYDKIYVELAFYGVRSYCRGYSRGLW